MEGTSRRNDPGEEAAGPELGYAHGDVPDACLEHALALSVAAVRPAGAEFNDLGVHHGVDHLLRQPSEQLLHVNRPVVEAGRGENVGGCVC